jgi:hypothetical protein
MRQNANKSAAAMALLATARARLALCALALAAAGPSIAREDVAPRTRAAVQGRMKMTGNLDGRAGQCTGRVSAKASSEAGCWELTSQAVRCTGAKREEIDWLLGAESSATLCRHEKWEVTNLPGLASCQAQVEAAPEGALRRVRLECVWQCRRQECDGSASYVLLFGSP